MGIKPGTVSLKWADGEYSFRLATGEWQELYRRVLKLLVGLGVSEAVAMEAATPTSIYRRVVSGNPLPGEVPEIIFQGLVGAGMAPQEAAALRNRYCVDRPLLESVPVAQGAMLVGLMGPPEADAKKEGSGDEPFSFRRIYEDGAAIGFGPREVDDMMLWEFGWVVAGFNRVQGGGEKPPPISDAEFDAEKRRHGFG